MKEIWKPIKNYEGLYDISNYGYIKSLKRKRVTKDRILKGRISAGYRMVILCKNRKQKTCKMSHLVYDHFGEGKRDGRILQVDHKNGIKTIDRIDNLQLLTNRENTSKGFIQNGKKTSKYTGVYWHKASKKWLAHIIVNRKIKYLGIFVKEKKASDKYQEALKGIEG